MEKEIIKYDASKVMEGVKDKIKATFVDLIPDDKWEEMIKTEIDKWLKSDNWNKSEFQQLVNKCLSEVIGEKLSAMIREKYISEIWENGQIQPTEELKKLIIENAGKVLLGMLGNEVQQALNNMRKY
jgi:hypothetical protein